LSWQTLPFVLKFAAHASSPFGKFESARGLRVRLIEGAVQVVNPDVLIAGCSSIVSCLPHQPHEEAQSLNHRGSTADEER
jgi:hypothetical protein